VCSIFESIGASVDLLLNSRATAVAIRRSLTSLARAVDKSDTALFYFSGHGSTEKVRSRSSEPQNIPLLLPYDTVQDDLMATAVPMEEMKHFLGMMTCKNVIFFFDSCYSGTAADTRCFTLPGMKANEGGVEMMPQIAGEGTVVLAACGEYEPAYEYPAGGHGIFTGCVLDALSGLASPGSETITVGSLYDYVSKQVPLKTETLFNGYKQRPRMYGVEAEPIKFPIMRSRALTKSLANFPNDFLPITVVVGDRREPDFKTVGDVYASSGSAAELRWLLRLGLPHDTEIISDKVFCNADDKFLTERYGFINILAIGSPAANLVARSANETAFFPFVVEVATREHWHKVTKELHDLKGQRAKIAKYGSEGEGRKDELLRYYLNQFRKSGFIDPTYNCIKRGESERNDKDYGVVTICRNPYAGEASTETLCIMAAGVHLPGTMHAVKLLSSPKSEFGERPLGGVFTITLPDIDWVQRVATGRLSWSTDAYSLNDFRERLAALKTPEKLHFVTGAMLPEDVQVRIDFLDQICQAEWPVGRQAIGEK